MITTKKKPARKTKKKSSSRNGKNNSVVAVGGDVFTLAETAAFLRVPEADVAQLAESHEIPARRIGSEWRFLKTAVEIWLGGTESALAKKNFWDTHFGALKGDPYLEEFIRKNNALFDRSEAEAG